MNILYLDKEGGFGGSSRSLYYLIKNIDRSRFFLRVIAREKGPIVQAYHDLGVTCDVADMPLFKASKRKNIFSLVKTLLKSGAICAAQKKIAMAARDADIIHFNHDGFLPYLFLNARYGRRKCVVHLRTLIPDNAWGRWQARFMLKYAIAVFCISENEKRRFLALSGGLGANRLFVVNNICEPFPEAQPPDWMRAFDGRFKILVMGNVAFSKGTDRAVAVARELKATGIRATVIVCGAQRNVGSRTDAMEDSLRDTVRREGLTDYCHFAGFCGDIAAVLVNSDAILRLSRENDPWGRDVIEAMTNGKPVLATGVESPYVVEGENGFLFASFEAAQVAAKIVFLANHPEEVSAIGERSRLKAAKLFLGTAVARQIEARYGELVS